MEMTLPFGDPAPVPVAFDYGTMAADVAQEARAAVERYRGRSRSYMMDTGRDLLAMKQRLEHGLFLRWVEAEMGLQPRTAQNFMQVAERFAGKSEIVSHLPHTVLYKLAAPSTPEPLLTAVLRRMEAGEVVQPSAILDEVRENREQAKKEAAVAREKARDARLTPEQRDYRDAFRARGQKRKDALARAEERNRLQRLEERRAEEAEARIGALYLLERLGADEISAFFMRFHHSARYLIFDMVQRLADTERAHDIEPVNLKLERVHGSSSYDYISPEDRERAQDLAQRFEAGEQVEPVVVVNCGTTSVPRYRIVEGEDRYHALRGVMGRETIPARIVPPVDPAAIAMFDRDYGSP